MKKTIFAMLICLLLLASTVNAATLSCDIPWSAAEVETTSLDTDTPPDPVITRAQVTVSGDRIVIGGEVPLVGRFRIRVRFINNYGNAGPWSEALTYPPLIDQPSGLRLLPGVAGGVTK